MSIQPRIHVKALLVFLKNKKYFKISFMRGILASY